MGLDVGVITLFPDLVMAVAGCGVTGRAVTKGLLTLKTWNPRDFARDRHKTVDSRPYGGGPGMVMLFEPLHDAIHAARAAVGPDAHVLAMTPQGRRLDQAQVQRLTAEERLIIVTGRYEGFDERLIENEVETEWSIGDYVISGGELAAMVLIDAMVRTLPGSLGHPSSAAEDSFADGLLDCPHYARPEIIAGSRVPDVLLSGNHEAIRRWRLQQALGRTWQRRPDLLQDRELTPEELALLAEYIEARKHNDR